MDENIRQEAAPESAAAPQEAARAQASDPPALDLEKVVGGSGMCIVFEATDRGNGSSTI